MSILQIKVHFVVLDFINLCVSGFLVNNQQEKLHKNNPMKINQHCKEDGRIFLTNSRAQDMTHTSTKLLFFLKEIFCKLSSNVITAMA